ncbi:MAG: DUF302 domain-containing protein [Kiritimatiellia bacterium]
MKPDAPAASVPGGHPARPFALGLLFGFLAALLLVWGLMKPLMLTTHASPYGVEETCQRLKASIEANGWRCPAIRDMNAAIEKEGLSLKVPVRIVELCKADYAQDVLETNPEVSTLMPCAFGVYEQDGRVYVTGLNTGLMGKLMGGNVARVMGGGVGPDEKKILECLN